MKIAQAITHFTRYLTPAYDNHHIATQVSWWLLQKAAGKSRIELIQLQEIDQQTQATVSSGQIALYMNIRRCSTLLAQCHF